jgi:NAD-dependent deacetylase
MSTDVLNKVAQHLKQAERVLFITGAGMSADSGLPTYRGIGGLYNGRLTAHQVPIEVALSGQMLTTSPEITWQYLYEIEQACRGASYNRGHEIIKKIQEYIPDTWILTQNIDGFHRQVGCKKLIEIHGRLYDLFCTHCDYETTVENYLNLPIPPKCPKCGHLVRPDVVLFGEMLPDSALSVLTKQLTQGFDVVFSIGTTSVFPYISAPVQMARQQKRITVEINPSTTEVSHLVSYRLIGGATDMLTQLWQLIDDI